MSSENQNTNVIWQLYEAFGCGDLPGVLSLVDTNVTWVNPYDKGHFPDQWSTPCHGHEEIRKFFQGLMRSAWTTPLPILTDGVRR